MFPRRKIATHINGHDLKMSLILDTCSMTSRPTKMLVNNFILINSSVTGPSPRELRTF